MFNSNVQPKRRIRARPTAWHCACRKPEGAHKLNGAQLTRCPICGSGRRDEAAVKEGARA